MLLHSRIVSKRMRMRNSFQERSCDRWQGSISTMIYAHSNEMIFVSFTLTSLLQAILLYDEKPTKFNCLHVLWDNMQINYYELRVLVSCDNGRTDHSCN
jgi:hypothetical protein